MEVCKEIKKQDLPPSLKIPQCLTPQLMRKKKSRHRRGRRAACLLTFCIFYMSIFKHINIGRMTEGKPFCWKEKSQHEI